MVDGEKLEKAVDEIGESARYMNGIKQIVDNGDRLEKSVEQYHDKIDGMIESEKKHNEQFLKDVTLEINNKYEKLEILVNKNKDEILKTIDDHFAQQKKSNMIITLLSAIAAARSWVIK